VGNSADILSGYALVNGKRAVYIPVTKRPDASTWSVVQEVRKALPSMQDAIPSDIIVAYEFDQSGYVRNALSGLPFEGALGALLTGLMI
jgi:multidrug efflux pump subunit AcrB